MAKRRFTILADEKKDTDVIEFLEDRPITETGLRLIRAAMVMEKCDIIDQLNLLVDKGLIDDIGPMETLLKAIEMVKMMQSTKPATVQSKPVAVPSPAKDLNQPIKKTSVFGARK